MFESTVISLDRIIAVLLDVMPGGRDELVEHAPGETAAASVTTTLGTTFSIRSARRKKLRGASTSRRAETSTSMTCPYWSTAR